MESNQNPGTEPTQILMQMIAAPWIAQAVYVAAKLNISAQLAGGPKSANELAKESGAHPDSLYRVMRALSQVGVYREIGDRRFEVTPLGEKLQKGVPGSVHAMATFFGEDYHWRPVGALLHSVQTGQPAFDHVYEMNAFEYFTKRPEAGSVFNSAMTEFSVPSAHAIVGAYDFSRFGSLVDVGGGHGIVVETILRANPKVKGTVYDLPEVVVGAKQRGEAPELKGRYSTAAGSFLESVPAGTDAYFMKHILHDWSDQHCIQILTHCRKGINKGGRLVVAEMVVPPTGGTHFANLLDIEMLIMTPGGRERTEKEFATLFAKAGFKLTRVVPTQAPISVIEAEPV
jgi:hypothetical protein